MIFLSPFKIHSHALHQSALHFRDFHLHHHLLHTTHLNQIDDFLGSIGLGEG